MKHWDKDKIKKYVKRTLVLLFCLGSMVPLMRYDAAAFDAQEVVEQLVKNGSRGIIYIFKWVPLMNGDNALPGTHYVTMLNEKNKCIAGPDILTSGPDNAQLQVSSNYTPYSYTHNRQATDIFYTLGSKGAPIIHRVNDDDDNNGYQHTYWLANAETNGASGKATDYMYAPTNAINRDGKGDWDEFSERYGKSLVGNTKYKDWFTEYMKGGGGGANDTAKSEKLEKYLQDQGIDLGQYNDDISFFTLCSVGGSDHHGLFHIFKNISHKRDPAWQCYGNGNIWCDQESDTDDRVWFNIWYGYPTAYSTLTQSYVIGSGQTLTLDSETEGYRGIYLLPTVTLKVSKGATLSINETVYNDGTILVDGGTLIIQGNGSLSPMSDDSSSNYSKNGKNKIIVQNGGVVIVMPGGKLYTTSRYPMTLINSRMINFGNYVLGGDLELYSSTVENRQDGKILCGWNYGSSANDREDERVLFQDMVVSANNTCSGMTKNNGGSTIYIYDTTAHNQKYDSLVGEENIIGGNIMPKLQSSSEAMAKLIETAIQNNNANINNVVYGSFS